MYEGKMRIHFDDRGSRYCDVFPEIGKGDINVTVVRPGCVALWHRHEHQDDYQFVVKGALKIGVCSGPQYMMNDKLTGYSIHQQLQEEWQNKYRQITLDRLYKLESPTDKEDYDKINERWPERAKVEWHILSDRTAHNGPLFIPRGLWHGCYNFTNEEAILIYHITNKYDGSDEDRCSPGKMGWSYQQEAK